MSVRNAWASVYRKLRRDRELPLRLLILKSVRYAWELFTARLYLLPIDRLGSHPRTLRRPRIQNWGRIEIGDDVLLRSVQVPVELVTGPHGTISIGNEVRINYGASIAAEDSSTIGNRVRIGPYVMIVDTDFHDPYDRTLRAAPRPVHIEDHVWIGAKASILRGVTIGEGSIVGTGAVVTRDVPPFTIVAGVPAKPVGTLDAERFRRNACRP